MKVLVINCGSSSLKYQVLDMTNEVLMCKGLVERIGMDGSQITHEKIGMEKFKNVVPMEDHKDAISHVLMAIQDENHGVVKSMDEIGAVGHRVVHGGEKFTKEDFPAYDMHLAVFKSLEYKIKETIKWEEHKVQNIWLTYPSDWEFEEGTEASNITKNEDVITICEEIWVDDTELYLLENELDNNIIESLKDKGTLTKERKYIMNQEWSIIYVRPKDGREVEGIIMCTIKNGWAYVVRILSNGDNKKVENGRN